MSPKEWVVLGICTLVFIVFCFRRHRISDGLTKGGLMFFGRLALYSTVVLIYVAMRSNSWLMAIIGTECALVDLILGRMLLES